MLNRDNVKQLCVGFTDIEEEGWQRDVPPAGFLVAGDDHVFYPARSGFFGNDVLVFHDLVPKPSAVATPGRAPPPRARAT